MPVEIKQWRATIGCIHVSMQKSASPKSNVRPFSILSQILKLYWFCHCFIAISVITLPFTLTTQFLAVHSVSTQLCFFPVFARMHLIAKTSLYIAAELLKRLPFGAIILIRYKLFTLKLIHSQYACFNIVCITCYILHLQWLVFRTILLSGDIETNPGPELWIFAVGTSITAFNFL